MTHPAVPRPILASATLALSITLMVPTQQAAAAGSRAFSHPDPALNRAERLDFKVGRGFFRRLWVSSPASTQAADGLGPLYNARSCMGCHPDNGRGHPLDASGTVSKSLVLRLDVPHGAASRPEPTYGRQLQTFGVVGQAAEGRLAVTYIERPVTLDDGTIVMLRQPSYSIDELGQGALQDDARLSARVAPQLIGLGLLDAIDDDAIRANADPEDSDGDGISGRVNRVWSPALQRETLGRFGHKAGQASLDEQSQSAFSIDLGISTPWFRDPAGDCTAAQSACRNAPHGDSPQYDNLEAPRPVTDLVHLYLAHLAVPPQRADDDPEVKVGQALFERIGCQDCHIAEWQTGSQRGLPANHHRTIRPYTDLLLHDMGDALADDQPEGVATGREWRTAPLWGIGLTEAVTGQASYLHDGRARTLLEAILWHGGEAAPHRDAVRALDLRERSQLLAFIESL
jgi:CxxC motif-containing protein (DUF1111 family)